MALYRYFQKKTQKTQKTQKRTSNLMGKLEKRDFFIKLFYMDSIENF